ncbi:MAG: hypothetical protein MK193_06140 [Lentisphaeria bacterium]|nr:hypothetical protein [Lentisphaeria bacterium]
MFFRACLLSCFLLSSFADSTKTYQIDCLIPEEFAAFQHIPVHTTIKFLLKPQEKLTYKSIENHKIKLVKQEEFDILTISKPGTYWVNIKEGEKQKYGFCFYVHKVQLMNVSYHNGGALKQISFDYQGPSPKQVYVSKYSQSDFQILKQVSHNQIHFHIPQSKQKLNNKKLSFYLGQQKFLLKQLTITQNYDFQAKNPR